MEETTDVHQQDQKRSWTRENVTRMSTDILVVVWLLVRPVFGSIWRHG